jgi:hypothetical protein
MSMKASKLVLGVLLLMTADVRAQQFCSDRIHFTTPTGRFTDHGNGTVTDKRTGLRWQRCPLGYTFDGNGTPLLTADDRCTATSVATFTWQQALRAAVAQNQQGGYAGFTDWRLPNIKELASIVESRCLGPAINQTVFPDTPPRTVFFSSSPNAGPSFTSILAVDFADGRDATVAKAGTAHVRLMR